MRIMYGVETLPSNSVLLGGRGSSSLTDNIKRTLGNINYFGSSNDRYHEQRKQFIDRYIEPIRTATRMVEDINEVMSRPNTYVPLRHREELRYIPPIMIPSILTHGPVFSLLRQGRISAWGYDYDDLTHEKEMYDRLLSNGSLDSDTVELTQVKNEETDEMEFILNYEYHSTDEELSEDDLDAIEETRILVDDILANTNLDPTDLDEVRG